MSQLQSNQKKEKNNEDNGMAAYSRYTTIAVQMVVIILGTTFGGIELDKVANTGHLFTVILSLLGVAAAMWVVIKEALKTK